MKLPFAGKCILRHCVKRKGKEMLVSLAETIIRLAKRRVNPPWATCALGRTYWPGYPGYRAVQDGDGSTNAIDEKDFAPFGECEKLPLFLKAYLGENKS